MDAESAPQFEDACQSCISEGETTLIADLSDLAYVSSMGLRSFIAVNQTLREKGGELRICSLKGLVRQVFQITGIDRIFPLHDSVETALMKG